MTSENTIQAWLKTAGTLPLLQARQPDAGLNMRLKCCGELLCVHRHYVELAIKRVIDAQPPAIYNHPPKRAHTAKYSSARTLYGIEGLR